MPSAADALPFTSDNRARILETVAVTADGCTGSLSDVLHAISDGATGVVASSATLVSISAGPSTDLADADFFSDAFDAYHQVSHHFVGIV